MATRKVLISIDFGAGWSTWADAELKKDFLFDPQLIADVEAATDRAARIAAAERFKERMIEKHGDECEHLYIGGARDLRVVTVDGPFIVDEYDGSETIILRDDTEWI